MPKTTTRFEDILLQLDAELLALAYAWLFECGARGWGPTTMYAPAWRIDPEVAKENALRLLYTDYHRLWLKFQELDAILLGIH